jgi:hypothetical protein
MNLSPTKDFKMSEHPSDSAPQTKEEKRLIARVAIQIDTPLAPKSISLADGVTVKIDGVNEGKRVICEAYAHVGEIKPGQRRKLAQDILKLILVERSTRHKWRKVICVNDLSVKRRLEGKSWLALAVKRFGIEVIPVSPSPARHAQLIAIQHRQRMVNP